MKTAFLISVMAPLALFGAFADKDWVKRTFAPTNAAAVADAAAVTNAQQAAAISDLQGGKQDKLPYATNAIPDSAIVSAATWNAKQDAISDYTTTGAVHSIVSNDVASWAMAGQPQPLGSVTDVKVDGTSVVSNGVANVTIPTETDPTVASWAKTGSTQPLTVETDPTVASWAKTGQTQPLTAETDPTVASWAKTGQTQPLTAETDPTVASWAKTGQTQPLTTETDPTVASWAKTGSTQPLTTETDPTVPSWAKETAPPAIDVPDTSSFSEWRIANSVSTNAGITVTAVHPPTYNDNTGKAVVEIVYEEGGETKHVYPEVMSFDGPTFGLSTKCYIWCDTVFDGAALLCFRRTTTAPLSKWSVTVRQVNVYYDSPYARYEHVGHEEPEFNYVADWPPDSHWRTKVWYRDLNDGTVITGYVGSADRQYADPMTEEEFAGLGEAGMRNYDLKLTGYANDGISVILSRYPCKRATRAEALYSTVTGIDDGTLATSAYVRQGLRGKADRSELSSKADVTYVNSASNNVLTAAKAYTDASVPTKVSDLTNDSGFITSSSLPTKVSDLSIDSATTNVIREVTGTFWDPGLTVTWRMFCTNGNFYVSAITNVNVTGVQ